MATYIEHDQEERLQQELFDPTELIETEASSKVSVAAATTDDAAQTKRRKPKKRPEGDGGEFIRSADDEVNLVRKPVEAIFVKPKEGRFTLQSRRWYNVLIAYAQRHPTPGQDGYYRITISGLARDANQERASNAYVAEVATNLLTTPIEWGDSSSKLEGKKYKWEAVTLLSYASIEKDNEADRTFLIFDFHKEIRGKFLKPEVYAPISLEHSSQMSTYAALWLYELGARYFKPGHEMVSKALPWKEWVVPMTGSADRDVEGLEYKFFARDTLKPALAEVNDLILGLPFIIIAKTTKAGRKTDTLKFCVVPREKGSAPSAERLQVEAQHLTLIGRLINLGVHQTNAESLYEKHGHAKLRTAIEAMESRRADEAIENPLAYIRSILKTLPASEVVDVTVKEVPVDATPQTSAGVLTALKRKYAAQQIEEATGLWEELPQSEQLDQFAAFEEEALPTLSVPLKKAWIEFRNKGSHKISKFLQPVFFAWWIRERAAPSNDEIMNWALKHGIMKIET